MAREYDVKLKEEPYLQSRQESWIRGLNTLVSATQIKDNEVAEIMDCELIEDGKIKCPRDGQAYYGATTGSRVTGLFSYYNSDGTKTLLRTTATGLYKYTDATTWTLITGKTYTTGLRTNGVMGYDRMYLCNGTDALTYYNGTDITTFTAISAPSAPTVTRTGGGTGTYTFSYKVTAVTAVGETTPSTAGTATLNQAALSATVYMTVTWTAVTSAIGYNVYGNKDGTWFFIKYVEGNGSGTTGYADTGADTPYEAVIPPEENTTGGPIGSIIEIYKDSLFIAGIDGNPSRLFYSRGGDLINNFSSDENGSGGFIDINKNDGQSITGLKVFKDNILVFKEDSIYQFSFTTAGLPQINQVNPSVGCIAPRSIVAVENDIFFLSRRGLFTIGNEAGFAFDVLRTNELSARVRSVMQNIDPAYIQNASAVYTTDSDKNLYILSYTPSGSTTNTSAVVYDRERLGFYKWTNINANCWTKFIGTDGIVHYLYGDDSSGYVKEILTGTDDFGSAINGYFYLKSTSFAPKSSIDRYKVLKTIDIVLRQPSGSITLSVVKDGVETSYTTPLSSVQPSINFGHYLISRFLFKTSYCTGVSSADELLLRTIRGIQIEGKTFQLRIDNNSVSSFVLLSAGMRAKARSESYRISTDVIST